MNLKGGIIGHKVICDSSRLKRVQRSRLSVYKFGERKNRFDKFPDVRFISSYVPLYSRNIGKETEVKTI